MFGSESYEFFESWWLQAYVNFGLPFVIAQLALACYAVLFCVRQALAARQPAQRRVYVAIATYAVFFNLAAFNLPFYTVFLLNLLYQLLVGMALFGRLDPRQAMTARPAAPIAPATRAGRLQASTRSDR